MDRYAFGGFVISEDKITFDGKVIFENNKLIDVEIKDGMNNVIDVPTALVRTLISLVFTEDKSKFLLSN